MLDTGRLVCMFSGGETAAGRPRRTRPGRSLARPVAVETARRTRRELGARLRALREGESLERPVLDAFDPGVMADPYAWYAELHTDGGVHYSERRDLWILSRYDHVKRGARASD